MKNKIWNKYKGYKLTIQMKLVLVFLLTSVIIFAVNFLIYMNINRMISRIDEIYVSNVSLNELEEILDSVQSNLTDYLNTKSSDSMEGYYKGEQSYRTMIEELNGDIISNDLMLLEKNIKNLSEQYLEMTSQTIEAKRGRNFERYNTFFDTSYELYSYINTYIHSLNNERFKSNTDNYEILLSSLKYSEQLNIAILLIVTVLNVMIIVVLTKNITNPLKKLAETADIVSGGGQLNLEVEPVEVRSEDEVGVVTKAFNQMLLSIKEYIEKVKTGLEEQSALKERELMMETHLKDAQLKYLQAQINPHFLFNTLNAGAQLAMMEGAEKTYTYVQNMADFFRYNVKKNNESVMLSEEIELVDNYVYILNVRFSGEIHFHKRIDNQFLHVHVPSMILQPIVENAINYAIRDITWEGMIELSVYEEDDHITISIRDNGIGMSQEKIDAIMNSRLKQADLDKNSNGIGLDNVIGRLRLFFDREDVLEITSAGKDMGTEVAIFVPYEKENGKCIK